MPSEHPFVSNHRSRGLARSEETLEECVRFRAAGVAAAWNGQVQWCLARLVCRVEFRAAIGEELDEAGQS